MSHAAIGLAQVDAPETTLTAESVFGALRGLETLSQLLERVEPPRQPPPDTASVAWQPSEQHQVRGVHVNVP